jgi:predicted dehydrogenase
MAGPPSISSAAGRPRILVVGAGSIGERHARCFLGTGRVDVALCEVDAERRRAVAGRCAISETYGSWEEGLETRPTAAVIATPAHLHIRMARAAVTQGCHVLIEKPLSVTTEGVDELVRELRESPVHAAVAYVYRSHPALSAMRDVLHSERFGRPLQVVAVSGQDFPFYRPAYRETYYTRHESGGGAVQDALTHVVNAVEWLVGPVTRLVADVEHLALPGVTVEDTVNVLTRHGTVVGSFSLNQHQAPNESTITVVCERGTIRFEFHQHRWRWVTEPGGAWIDEETDKLERDTLFIAQANQFLDLLDGRAGPRCSVAEARQTLLVNRAILDSARDQTWHTIPTAGDLTP